MPRSYMAVAFDLLTALLDSWTLWNRVAGGPDAGMRWRGEYLRLTYGAGRYHAYEELVHAAALATGLPASAGMALCREWDDLRPWPEAPQVLEQLASHVKLAVVTNCSEALACRAVAATGVTFDVVVTSERAAWYKPRPEPYQLALRELSLPAGRVLFVAGSPYDITGAGGVGMPVFWHNRIGLPLPAQLEVSVKHLVGASPSLLPLVPLVLGQVPKDRQDQRVPSG